MEKASFGTTLLVLLLVGCTQEPPRAPVSVAAPQPIVITDASIDGYPPGSMFDIDLVREALPGYDVVEAIDGSEGMEWTVFHVLQGGEVLLQIDPGPMGTRVGAVQSWSPEVATETGHRVGSLFSAVYGQGGAEHCSPGMEELSGYAICAAPEMVQLRFVFGDAWDGFDGELPPREVLDGWTIDRVAWTIYAADDQSEGY